MPKLQLDLLAPARMPVIPDGAVCGPEYPVQSLRAPVPGCRYGYATIELAQHVDGRWMWGTSYATTWSGGGYRIGPKWGQFADTRAAALREALLELDGRVPAQTTAALTDKARAAA